MTRVLVVVQEYPQISETYIKNELDALAGRFDLELLALLPGSYPYRSRRGHIVLSQSNQQNVLDYLKRFAPSIIHGHYLAVLPAVLRISERLNVPFTTALPTDTPNFNGHLVFAPPSISSTSELFGIFVYGGRIDSFDTALLPFVSSTPTTTDSWWLQFVSGQMPTCPYGPCITDVFDTSLRGVYLYADSMTSPVAMAQYTGPAIDLAVPEPGTLGLMLGALGGGWLARRRRRERDPPPD